MAQKIKSISISPEHEKFLEETGISLSAIAQEALNKAMEMSKVTGAQLAAEVRKREAFQKIAEEARVFIEKHGLLDEWIERRGY